MKRRRLLKGIGAAGLLAVSGTVTAVGTTDDGRTIVEASDGPGDYFVVGDSPVEGGLGPESHGGGDCFIYCCTGDCPCETGCHCLEPGC